MSCLFVCFDVIGSIRLTFKRIKNRWIWWKSTWNESSLKNSFSKREIENFEFQHIYLIWGDTSEDHTFRVGWLLSNNINYSELRKYFFKHCNHYSSNINYSIEIKKLNTTDNTIMMINIDFTRNVIEKTLNDITYTEEILFDMISLDLPIISKPDHELIDLDSDDLLNQLDKIMNQNS